MSLILCVKGDIAKIIRNDEGLYEGNLIHYFRIIRRYAQNLNNPYHNLGHMLNVAYLCYQACKYYAKKSPHLLLKSDMRVLLIGALMHDFNHTGRSDSDAVNIERAIRGLKMYADITDKHHIDLIINLVKDATENPYLIPSEKLTLPGQILRDADRGQALHVVWIQQVLVGLAAEWGVSIEDVLRLQAPFHQHMEFATEWARDTFPPSLIEEKIIEAEELLEMLTY